MIYLLAFRSFALALFEKKGLFFRLVDCSLLLFYFFLALLFPLHSTPLFFGAAVLIGLSLFLRLKKPYAPTFPFRLFKAAAFCGFLLVYTLAFSLFSCFSLSQDHPVLKVNLTGNKREEWIEWKNPRGVLKKVPLTAHEVKLEAMDGKNLGTFYVLGDQVALKAKVIRFSPLLNALGLENRCKIEAVHNSYTTAERGDAMPVQYEEFHFPRRIEELIWHFWEPIYLQERSSAWIKSATLESNYFPLGSEKSYLLTINQGGLSSTN